MTLERTDQFCSVDPGIYRHLTLRNLTALAEERGDRAEARRLWRMIVCACSGDPEAMSRVGIGWGHPLSGTKEMWIAPRPGQ